MAFDLAVLDTHAKSQEGTDLVLIHPRSRAPMKNDAGEDVAIKLKGRTSDEFREVERRVRDRNADRLAKQIKRTQEDSELEEIEYLTAVTVAWNFDKVDGNDFPCNAANARRLWGDIRFRWIKEAALAHVLNDANFLAN